MTDTSEPTDVEDEEEGEDIERDIEKDSQLCVEKSTNLIYEVQFFGDFALVRPASPAFNRHIQKLTILEYSRYFNEFLGDSDQVWAFLYNGGESELDVEVKH